MMCAAICDNTEAVHELAAQDFTNSLVNQGLKRQGKPRAWLIQDNYSTAFQLGFNSISI